MTFKLDHWRNPRATIASNLRRHDIEYATHGAIEALKILKFTNLSIQEMSKMTILDYGCGTGRMARPLTALFKHVYAYDPVAECIQEGQKECGLLKFKNLTMTSDFNAIPKVDFAISINVIEHLTDADANVMIANLAKVVQGPTAILYSLAKNKNVITPYLSDKQIEADAKLKKDKPEARITGNLVDFRVKQR